MLMENNNLADAGSKASLTERLEVKNGVIANVTTGSDRFVELINIIFEYTAVLVGLPVILLQEFINTWRNWRGVDETKLDKLEGKVVLITGANSGIGESVAKYFFQAGCRIILAARRKNELERVRDELTAMKTLGTVTHIPSVLELDLADMKSISRKAEAAIEIHGAVDILLNNAGVYNQGHVLETVMEVDERIMSVNYLGTLALTKAIGNHMLSRKQGHIAFVSSVLGKMTITNSLAYSASKHALQALADSLRAEVYSEGISVTIVSPSYVNTAITVNAFNASGDKYGVVTKEIETGYTPEYVAERIFKAVVNQEADVTIAPLIHRGAIYLRNFLPTVFFACVRIYGRRFKAAH